MTTEGNKAVVRRFVNEVLGGGNIDAVDELLEPNYVNLSLDSLGRDGFKGLVTSMKAHAPKREFKILDLVAEGDTVFFRGDMTFTLATGKKVSSHVLTYYRLAGGKIVVDDPMSVPPLTEVLSGMMPPKPSP